MKRMVDKKDIIKAFSYGAKKPVYISGYMMVSVEGVNGDYEFPATIGYASNLLIPEDTNFSITNNAQNLDILYCPLAKCFKNPEISINISLVNNLFPSRPIMNFIISIDNTGYVKISFNNSDSENYTINGWNAEDQKVAIGVSEMEFHIYDFEAGKEIALTY